MAWHINYRKVAKGEHDLTVRRRRKTVPHAQRGTSLLEREELSRASASITQWRMLRVTTSESGVENRHFARAR